jgi:hypothetical protein
LSADTGRPRLKTAPRTVDSQGMTDTILPQVSSRPSGTGPSRQRPSRPVLIAAVVALIVLVAGGGYELTKSHSKSPTAAPLQIASPKPTANTKPATRPVAPHSLAGVLAATTAHALAAKSVTDTVRDVSAKHGVIRYSEYHGTTDGIQRVSFADARSTVRVVGKLTYFSGNRAGLVRMYGLSAAQAKQVGRQWVPLVPGEPGYKNVTAGVTLASALSEIHVVGPLRRLPVRVKDGQRVFGIAGRATGPGSPKGARAILWISVGAKALPVEYDAIAKGNTEVLRFSRWGRVHAVRTPLDVLGQTGLSS